MESKDDLFGDISQNKDRKKFGKLLDSVDLKRKRDENTEAMRKKNREAHFTKKRIKDSSELIEEGNEVLLESKESQILTQEQRTAYEILRLLSSVLLEFKDPSKHLHAFKLLRSLLVEKEFTPIQQVIDAGAIPLILNKAQKDDDSEMQVIAVIILV